LIDFMLLDAEVNQGFSGVCLGFVSLRTDGGRGSPYFDFCPSWCAPEKRRRVGVVGKADAMQGGAFTIPFTP
jgi:hypothetical protein